MYLYEDLSRINMNDNRANTLQCAARTDLALTFLGSLVQALELHIRQDLLDSTEGILRFSATMDPFHAGRLEVIKRAVTAYSNNLLSKSNEPPAGICHNKFRTN